MKLRKRASIGVLAIGCCIAAALAAPCFAETPEIGPAFPIGSVRVPAPHTQSAAAAVGINKELLVVWQDKRTTTDFDIYGIFVDKYGKPTRGESFIISCTASGTGLDANQQTPDVAFDGTSFLVVWTDYRQGPLASHVYGARVAADGTVLDPGGIPVSLTGSTYQDHPAVASAGSGWEVVYQQYNSGIDIVGARVNPDGSVASRTNLSASAADETSPCIDWNGVNFIVAWEDIRNVQTAGQDIYSCAVNAANQKVAGDTLVSRNPSNPSSGAPNNQGEPAITLGYSGNCFVVWEDGRQGGYTIFGTRLNSTGVPLDSAGIAISTGGNRRGPGIGWDGTSYVVAYRNDTYSRTVRATRVSNSGSVMDANGFAVSNVVCSTAGTNVACSGGSSLVIYETQDATDADVLGSVIKAGATTAKDLIIAASAQDQQSCAAAFDGGNHVVVWSDRRSGKYAIYAARVMTDGTVLDANGVRVHESDDAQVEPAIAWGGDQFLVVWSEGPGTAANIKGKRLDRNLAPLHTGAINVCMAMEAQTNPSVGYNGTQFLVAWVDGRNGISPDYFTDVYCARVSAAGAVNPTANPLCIADNFQYAPSVSSNGTDFFVAWEDYRNNWTPDIYASGVSSTGTIQNSAGIRVSTATAYKYTPSVAYDGTNYLIVWCGTAGDWAGNIFGVRMTHAGARVDATDIPICNPTGKQDAPVVVWTGSNYYVAWQDFRNEATLGCNIYFARLSPGGAILDPGVQALCTESLPETAPALCAAGPDWTGIFYGRSQYAINRMTGRTLGDPQPVSYTQLSYAKLRPDDTYVLMPDKIVTAGSNQLGTCFYIEDRDRTGGIKVVSPTLTASEGQVVSVEGVLDTVDGERQVNAVSVTILGGPETVAPFYLGLGGLSGAPLGEFTPGVKFPMGPHNVGLLVKTSGRVVERGANYFYVFDGLTVQDPDTAPLYVKVICPPGVDVPQSDAVIVTGISSIEPEGDHFVRRLMLRKSSDIETYP